MGRYRVAFCIAGLLVLQACGGSAADRGDRRAEDAETRYRATATVLEDPTHAPMLCLSAILESLPPQCGDVPISNWDWEEVPGEERLAGTTWGSYEVVGTYDGTSFTVEEVRPEGRPEPTGDLYGSLETPCPEPEGGWVAPDPDRTSEEDRLAATRLAESRDDFAGVWVSHEAGIVLNVAFTGDVARHRRELSELWGGPLCVVEHARTFRELERIQRAFDGDPEDLQVLWSDIAVVRNVVLLGVVVGGPREQAALDERFGRGAVQLVPALHPVR